MDFISELKNKSDFIESEIYSYLPVEEGYQKTLFSAMNYSFKAGGKRLRPILIMEAYSLCGGKGSDYIPYSAAIEMIHTYSLIHDDLPALDNDDLRRGKPTNHKVFGEAMAILAGDGLLNWAYEIILNQAVNSDNKSASIKACKAIADGAGIYGMVGGQVVDVESESKEIDIQCLEFIHLNKTAAMIIACMKAGAYLAGADDDTVKKLENYGKCIGLAFQIADDILDIEGDEKELGKKIGSDIDNDKATYPHIVGMERSKELAKDLIDRAKLIVNDFENSEFLASLADYIINRNK
ncbi:farnesyl-diphosphate synthase [Peptostreptococcus sp. MV1]|uniref:polyprenyl synthetase family protein n=1 Tax=Peptostreptococcus sp. MV1 TaxID=1219626 RepID=UPI00050F74AD|nr:farnesyl diphosphate synthase [Peptostreptococcus sp. MV1]KGF12246.1 farnesyl-diphosphate synthase [Peptostreptococcus sp. MV1]